MERFDINCYCGYWPFHSTRRPYAAQIQEDHRKQNIGGGLITSLQTVFYLDPLSAAQQLSNELPAGYGQIFAINPNLPDAVGLSQKAVADYGVRGLRLVPAFHDFSWTDPAMQGILSFAEGKKLPLFLTLNLEDPRLDHMLLQKPLNMNDLSAAILDLPSVPLIITNAYLKNIAPLSSAICSRENIFADTSALNSPLLALDQALDFVGSEHLMYGSGANIQALSSSVQNMLHADLTEDQAKDIWYRNATKIFG